MYNLQNENSISGKILDYWVKGNISDCSKNLKVKYSLNKNYQTKKMDKKNYGKKTLNKSKS